MPAVFPFRAVQYRQGEGDVSGLIAPPYDVLDAAAKRRLLALEASNIVGFDLPHVPPKELGPPEAYDAAGRIYRELLKTGVLSRRERPAVFAYRQTFMFSGGRHERCGMACTVETLPFGARVGGGVLPHEETFSGPKEDRLALMKSARAQFSPIFGLHPDEKGEAVRLVRKVMGSRRPDLTGTTDDGVRHEVWMVEDAATIGEYAGALAGQDVFIADGHHRYTTALNYLKHLESLGRVPADHPARRCMFVLVGMSDPGLVIGPTHRVLGGMKDYSFEKLVSAAKGILEIRPAPGDIRQIERAIDGASAGAKGATVLGLYDFATGRPYLATLTSVDPLKGRFPDKPREWRTLDVAITQYVIVEEICQPRLNSGDNVKWAFPHSVEEIVEIGHGHETGAGGGKGFAQLAVIVRPTPLESVRAVSRAGELMPQKSTFFYPKLATGLFLNPLE